MKRSEFLFNIGLSGLALVNIACSGGIRPNSTPDNRTISTATATAKATETALFEARRLGQLLATFDYRRVSGLNLDKRSNAKLGNITIGNSSGIDLVFDLDALKQELTGCGTALSSNYQLGIEFTDALPDGSTNSLLREFDNYGTYGITKIVTPDYFKGGNMLKDKVITPDGNPENDIKRGVLKANMDLAETVCSLGYMAQSFRQGIYKPGSNQIGDVQSSQKAKRYMREVLEGKKTLIVTSR